MSSSGKSHGRKKDNMPSESETEATEHMLPGYCENACDGIPQQYQREYHVEAIANKEEIR